jgi:hypothetical protein
MSPVDTLRAYLHIERRKKTPFPQAWQRACAQALLDSSPEDLRDWEDALLATRDEWEKAYGRRDASLLGYLALETDAGARW